MSSDYRNLSSNGPRISLSGSSTGALTDTKKILYISVGRIDDRCVLASYNHDTTFQNAKIIQRSFLQHLATSEVEFGINSTFESPTNAIHYFVDVDGYFYFCIFVANYPARIAFKMLQEVLEQFKKNFPSQMEKGVENELTKASKTLLAAISNKYDDLKAIDNIEKVQQKLNTVKGTMTETISVMLENHESAERALTMAEDINSSAQVFKRNTKELRGRLRCRAYKYHIIVAIIVLVIIGAIIGCVYMFSEQTKK